MNYLHSEKHTKIKDSKWGYGSQRTDHAGFFLINPQPLGTGSLSRGGQCGCWPQFAYGEEKLPEVCNLPSYLTMLASDKDYLRNSHFPIENTAPFGVGGGK